MPRDGSFKVISKAKGRIEQGSWELLPAAAGLGAYPLPGSVINTLDSES